MIPPIEERLFILGSIIAYTACCLAAFSYSVYSPFMTSIATIVIAPMSVWLHIDLTRYSDSWRDK